MLLTNKETGLAVFIDVAAIITAEQCEGYAALTVNCIAYAAHYSVKETVEQIITGRTT